MQSELQRTLFLVNVKVDKQKILLKKKLDDFYHKKIVLEVKKCSFRGPPSFML